MDPRKTSACDTCGQPIKPQFTTCYKCNLENGRFSQGDNEAAQGNVPPRDWGASLTGYRLGQNVLDLTADYDDMFLFEHKAAIHQIGRAIHGHDNRFKWRKADGETEGQYLRRAYACHLNYMLEKAA